MLGTELSLVLLFGGLLLGVFIGFPVAFAMLGSGLIVGQVAVALTLLMAVGMLTQSLIRMQKEELGFRPENVLVLVTPGTFSSGFTMAKYLYLAGATLVGTPSAQAADSPNRPTSAAARQAALDIASFDGIWLIR